VFPFAIVMTEPLLKGLKPDVDMYYDSGLKGGPTTPKVLYSDMGSVLYEIGLIVFIAVPFIPWSLYKRLTRKKDPYHIHEEKAK